MALKELFRIALADRGYQVQVYGEDDDPIVNCGLVPDDILWECYSQILPTPCFHCFVWGHGERCLAGDCQDPEMGEAPPG